MSRTRTSWWMMTLPGRMLLRCFANVVFPEHVAPLQIVIIDCDIVHGTHPTPTNTTLVLTIALELQIIPIGTSVRANCIHVT